MYKCIRKKGRNIFITFHLHIKIFKLIQINVRLLNPSTFECFIIIIGDRNEILCESRYIINKVNEQT